MNKKIICANKLYDLESGYDRYLLHEFITDFAEDNLDYLSKKYKIGKCFDKLGNTKEFFIEVNKQFNLEKKDYDAIFEEILFIEKIQKIQKIQKLITNKNIDGLFKINKINHRYNKRGINFKEYNFQNNIINENKSILKQIKDLFIKETNIIFR